jgi:hypothetical protein
MSFKSLSALTSQIIRWPRHLLMAGSLCLLVACGGGGGGGSTTSSGAAPSIALTRSGSTDAIFSGNAALLVPTFSYGTAVLSWQNAQGQTLTQVATSTAAIQVNPTQTTTYTLTVSYQDPTTVRPQILTSSAAVTVNVRAADGLTPTIDLVADTLLVTTGGSVTLTPTFSWSAGTILSSAIKYEAQTVNVSSTGAITRSPITNTTYTLRVEYRDERVIPNVVAVIEKAVTVEVSDSPGNLTKGGLLAAGRSDHIMVQLPSSPLVLVAGGTSNGTTVIKTAELYDPVTNTWRATGEMKTARRGHTATVLNNGKILVVGGNDGTNALSTAETYDPSTGVWTNTIGPLAYTHRYHTATLLSDGKVLIAGGTVGPLGTADAKYTEVYSPLTGTFSAGPLLPEERQGHTATMLSNGDVLFVGNSIGNGALVRTLKYDGTTFTWAHLANPVVSTGSLAKARYNHSATLLSSGKVLVTGGFSSDPTSAELYDPTARTWSATTNNMSTSRSYQTSTTLRNGDVLVIGGYDGATSLSTLDYYYASTNTWSVTAQKLLSTPRAMNTSLMLSNGKVLTLGSYCPVPSGACTTYTSTEIWAP